MPIQRLKTCIATINTGGATQFSRSFDTDPTPYADSSALESRSINAVHCTTDLDTNAFDPLPQRGLMHAVINDNRTCYSPVRQGTVNI